MTLKPPSLRHRLILKIMLIFWLTTLATIFANVYITKEIVVTEYKKDHLREKLRGLSKEAIAVYESGGKTELRHWYEALAEDEQLRVILLDAHQRPIAKPARSKDHDDQDDQDDNEHHRKKRFGFNKHMLKFADQNIVSASGMSYTLRVLPSPYLRSAFNPETLHLSRLSASFIIILFGSWWLARSVSRPVNVLRQASAEIAKGNFEVRVKEKVGNRKDELGQLGQSFDHMASKIESLIGSQKQLFRDISHEMRTPLTRQKIAIELAHDPANTASMLVKIEQQNQVIEDLIENLLTLMQLEDSQGHPMAAIDMTEIIHSVIDAAELNLSAKGLQLLEKTAATLPVWGDSTLLTRALENLLINAVKYSPEQSAIHIEGKHTEENVIITISDEGPGIPEQELANILKAFYRADKSRHNTTGGFGLGLAITDKIVRQHGGSLAIENRAPSGLCVTIVLPWHQKK